jgi:hypothetical protein
MSALINSDADFQKRNYSLVGGFGILGTPGGVKPSPENAMTVQRVVELPSGNKLLFGRLRTTRRLSEVAISEDTAKATADSFKAALGLGSRSRLAIGEMGAAWPSGRRR